MGDYSRDRELKEAVSQVRQLLKGVQGATAPAWLELDLSMGQLRTLFALQACGTTSLGCLAQRLSVGAATASVVVDRLVRRGFVDRSVDAADRRRLLLSVSARGDELLTRLRQGHQQVIESLLEDLDDSELEGLCFSLRPVVRSMATLSDRQASAASAAVEAPSSPGEADLPA